MAKQLRKVLSNTILEASLILVTLLGILLRVYQITLQIPADDEWHALHAVMTGRFLYVATHLGVADHCIPMALAFSASYLLYGLSESILRFPSLFFGIALLIVGPWVVRIWFGRTASVTFAWLLAVSPLLIFYSRYARPYTITAFFCFIAAFAFFEWWKGGDRSWKLVYATCAILGPYFHLSALPFVAAPMGFGLVELLTSKQARSRSWKELAHVSVLVFGGLALFLGPALMVDQTAWSGKLSLQKINSATLHGSAELLAGTSSSWLVAGVLLLAGTGSISLIYKRRRLGLYLLFLIVAQVSVNVLVGPTGSQVPIVFVRYSLACLPLSLLFVAVAVSSLEDRTRGLVPIPEGTLAVLLGGSLLLLGPLTQIYYYPNNWTNHGLFQYCYDSSNRNFHYRFVTRPLFFSEFYRELGKQPPGSVKLLEAPWYYEWPNNPFPHFQQLHRQEMMIGFVDDPEHWSRAGEYPPRFVRMKFRSFAHLSQHDEIAAQGVDYVVLHKHLESEVPNAAVREPVDMTHWISEYKSLYGGPYFEDTAIVVFKTDRQKTEK